MAGAGSGAAGAVSARATEPDFGPYRVLELIGRGGMGTVHRAYDTRHDRTVALKRLSGALVDAEFRARFRREGRIVSGLRHPHVIPVHAVGEIDGQLYLDMELVAGVDLRRLLGVGALDRERAVDILDQVAHALDAAHAQGLVHRDVKPSNILVGPDDHAYLVDFGIARSVSSDSTALTATGELVGIWDYIAPERLSGGPVDSRADQYSLACVLFECLTGRLPHPAAEPAAKLAAHLLRPPPAPSVFDPTISPALDAPVVRGMAKDPARRFPAATGLLAAARTGLVDGTTARLDPASATGPSPATDQAVLMRAVLRSTATPQPTIPEPRIPTPVCPYPGLRGFERVDARWFHGRDHVVTDVLVRLAEQLDGGEPVVLVGASGAGKSSVLRAGLLPALAAAAPAWPQLVCTPGPDPIAALAGVLGPPSGLDPVELAEAIRRSPDGLAGACRLAAGAGRLVLVVDQFEELFTHGAAEAERLAFAAALAAAQPALVVLAVRADLVERCIALPPLVPALRAPVLLGPLTDTELREAIVAPARDAGIEVEAGLPERLIADLGAHGETGYDPGSLPRLAHALRETWQHGDGSALTLAGYRRAGGIDGAVARTAEELYAGLDDAGRAAARTVLLRLVALTGNARPDDAVVLRRRAGADELAAPAGATGVLDRLIAARLVTVDERGAQLSHEALLTAWPRLRDWVDADRAGLVAHQRFAAAARAWADAGQQADDLYRGVRLDAVNTWLAAAGPPVALQPVEQQFLSSSNTAERAGEVAARRRTRRLRTMVATLSVLLLVAAGAVIVATTSRRDALDARQLALSRQLASESAGLARVAPRRSALLALGAWRAAPTVESRSALLSSAAAPYRGAMSASDSGLVTSIAISGDGRTAATGAQDGTLRLWDVPNHRGLGQLGSTGGWYRSVSMSTDGRLLVAANPAASTVTVWSLPDRRVLFTEPGVDAAISPDGRSVAVNVDGDRMLVRDTAGFAERAAFRAAQPFQMTFSPDGAQLALAVGNDIQLRRVRDGVRTAVLTGHTDQIRTVGFDPTGARLVSASKDRTVHVWDVATGRSDRTLTPAGGVFASTFLDANRLLVANSSPGVQVQSVVSDVESRLPGSTLGTTAVAVAGAGRVALGAAPDGEVTVWSLDPARVGLGDRSVSRLAVNPAGPEVLTVAGDRTAWLWDRTTGARLQDLNESGADFTDAAFSPDGARTAMLNRDGAIRLWDSRSGQRLAGVQRPDFEPLDVTFSPDGTLLAVAGRSTGDAAGDYGEILLLRTPELSLITAHPTGPAAAAGQPIVRDSSYPQAVAFSPDGRLLAAALSSGRVALLRPLDRGTAPVLLPGHQHGALDVAFSPDGTLLASGGADGRVRLWRVPGGAPAGELVLGSGGARAVTFSPDGSLLAAAGLFQVLRVWDVPSRQPVVELDRPGDAVNDLTFDRDGTLVSGSADGGVSILGLDPERAARELCTVLGPDTVAAEWRAPGPAPPVCR